MTEPATNEAIGICLQKIEDGQFVHSSYEKFIFFPFLRLSSAFQLTLFYKTHWVRILDMKLSFALWELTPRRRQDGKVNLTACGDAR